MIENDVDEENLDQDHEEKKEDNEQDQEIKEHYDENEQDKDGEDKNEIKIIKQEDNEEQNENNIEEEQLDENKIIEGEKNKGEENQENNEKDEPIDEEEQIKKIKIYISGTSELGGKTLYHIKGDFIPGDREIHRRYRDFDLLHKKLSSNWPCVFIPPIPPKKYFKSSTDKEIVKERLFQLENFLKMCSDYPYIFGAPEMKLFLSLEITSSDKLQSMMKKLPSYGYKKISEIYTLLFSKHKTMKKDDLTDDKLSTYIEYITAFITKLNEYKKQLVILGDIKKDNIYRENKVIEQLIDFEKNGMVNYINDDKSLLYFYDDKNTLKKNNEKYEQNISQPYLILSGWIRLKELELNAIKDKLNEYKEYINKKISYNNKLREMEEKSHSINEGRVSFFDKIFSKGDIGKLKENHNKDLENHRAETNYLNTIVNIAGDYIAVEYNKYFSYLTKNFYYVVRNFANTQKENSKAALDLWLQIKSGKEIEAEKNNDNINNE